VLRTLITGNVSSTLLITSRFFIRFGMISGLAHRPYTYETDRFRSLYRFVVDDSNQFAIRWSPCRPLFAKCHRTLTLVLKAGMRDVQSTSITNEQEKADSARAKPLFFSLCRFSPNHRCDCSAISYVDVDDDECSFSHSLIFRFFILATVGRIRQCGVRQAHQGIVEFVAHFVQLIFFFFVSRAR
jgi:hypothetical protein